jgi:Nucleotidyl transferase of unknown function (DUF2204)
MPHGNSSPHHNQSTPEGIAFYGDALARLAEAGIPFLVGGGYAIQVHTGIARATKDFDLFVLSEDVPRMMQIFASAGYRTELTFPHWLGKAFSGDELIDIIFSSGNGLCPVDQRWFEHAIDGIVLGLPVQVCPPEETIWQKAFIMERDRYDGADVAHLLRACGRGLDWQRLLERFGPHWRVLLAHLVLFGYVYPGERHAIPEWVLRELTGRLIADSSDPPEPVNEDHLCRGTLFSREQYEIDVDEWGYRDARLAPVGHMTNADVARWTAAAPGNGRQPSM